MKHTVFNNELGSPYVFGYPNFSIQEEQKILANLFEQLLIFDRLTLSTSRQDFALAFLLKNIGINSTERLLDAGYLQFLLWTPIIVTSTGRQNEDNTIDTSTIYGQPPVIAGELGPKDLDPEENIHYALSLFGIHKDRIRSFSKKALKDYIVPKGMEFSKDSAKLVIEAYENNNLSMLGMPYQKESNQLDLEERNKLLNLSHKVMETAILSQYGFKSYENYEPYEICKKNIENIGKAYNISENTSMLFKLENLPNLKELFLQEKLSFDSVFKIRHLSTAKYYRSWINKVGENSDSLEVTREYLNEIKGTNKFFESTSGKLTKTLSLFAINSAIGAAVAGPVGAGVGLTMGILEAFWLEGILKGKNPSMFIDDVEKETEEKNDW